MSLDLFLSSLYHPERFLLLLLYKTKLVTKPRQVKLKTTFGKTMTVVLPEIVSSLLYLTGKYESDVEDTFRKFVKKDDIVVDIGAHFGYFTLLASTLVGKKGKVYAFEPTPSTYAILKKNTEKQANVIIVNKAVYDKSAKLTLHDYGMQYGALNSFFEPRIGKHLRYTSAKVSAVTLDSFFPNPKNMPTFIKIDAESSEYFILRGMKNILLKKKPIICMEMGDMDVSGVKTSKELIMYLKNKKYNAYLFQNKLLRIYDGQLLDKKHINLLFIPNT